MKNRLMREIVQNLEILTSNEETVNDTCVVSIAAVHRCSIKRGTVFGHKCGYRVCAIAVGAVIRAISRKSVQYLEVLPSHFYRVNHTLAVLAATAGCAV